MAVIGFGEGTLDVEETPHELLERIQAIGEPSPLDITHGGISLAGWINVTRTDGTSVAVQAAAISYIGLAETS
jgi:hypothetical protein